jgi:hypothetical protein
MSPPDARDAAVRPVLSHLPGMAASVIPIRYQDDINKK